MSNELIEKIKKESWFDGYNCAIQELVSMGKTRLAVMIIKESNEDIEEFKASQKRSGYLDDEMGELYEIIEQKGGQ